MVQSSFRLQTSDLRLRSDMGNFYAVPADNRDQNYDTYQEAFKRERQLKKWSLAKKEALISGDIERLKELSKSK